MELKEIIEWVESNQKAMELFARFEPKYYIPENVNIFKPFRSYTEEQAQSILKQINKANLDENFFENLANTLRGSLEKTYLK